MVTEACSCYCQELWPAYNDAISARDYPVIQGIVLLFQLPLWIVNLMVDVTYTLVDPGSAIEYLRIKHEAPLPPALVIAPQLPDLLLPVAIRRGVFGFCLRIIRTVAIGGALLLCLVLVGIFAPWLGTVEPTRVAPRQAYTLAFRRLLVRHRPAGSLHLFTACCYGGAVSLTWACR